MAERGWKGAGGTSPGSIGGSIAQAGRDPTGRAPGAERPDLEGVRATREDVGALPVPRSVLQSKGKPVPRRTGAPYDVERGLLPGARRPVRPLTGDDSPRAHRVLSREAEATLRRTHARAALTPEQLGRALSRVGDIGLRDPQAGKEGGPPLPNEDAPQVQERGEAGEPWPEGGR